MCVGILMLRDDNLVDFYNRQELFVGRKRGLWIQLLYEALNGISRNNW